ncbi:MAG: ribosome biogenesis GTPase Der [Acidobacteriota bacterium]
MSSGRNTDSKSRNARPPVIALVGRPNVGKSSLFNRLLRRRDAIVLDRPGVTRDRLERRTRLQRRTVMLQDTGGILPDCTEELFEQVTRQAVQAIKEADLVLMLVDARAGVVPLDERVADYLRTARQPVLLVMNKCDTVSSESIAADGWRLGLGEPIAVSAEHGLGIDGLIDRIESLLDENLGPAAEMDYDEDLDALPDPGEELHLAIVGRPNVGKSSLINRLLGEERVTVSAVPGTTRDAIDVQLVRDGRRYRLIDTAGLRRRSKTASADESIGIMLTRRRLARAHLAIQVIDATEGITSGDVAIAGEIEAAGRPLLLALNKWDLVQNPEERVKQLDDAIVTRLAFLPADLARVTVSAATGQRAFKLLDQATELADLGSRKVPTSELNRFLESTTARHIMEGGRVPKMLYITQSGTLPPRFIVFCRDVAKISDGDRRFLEHRLRDTFGLGPVPIRIDFRTSPRR